MYKNMGICVYLLRRKCLPSKVNNMMKNPFPSIINILFLFLLSVMNLVITERVFPFLNPTSIVFHSCLDQKFRKAENGNGK